MSLTPTPSSQISARAQRISQSAFLIARHRSQWRMLAHADTVSSQMSKSAQGYMRSMDPLSFTGSFIIEDEQYAIMGRLNNPMPPFTTTNSTILYDDPSQLNGQRPFRGTLGPVTVDIQFDNGTTLSGPLGNPLPQQIPFSGVIVWAIA